jgi:hypothetical protein
MSALEADSVGREDKMGRVERYATVSTHDQELYAPFVASLVESAKLPLWKRSPWVWVLENGCVLPNSGA